MLTQTATVKRPDHTLTGGVKANTFTTLATGVSCLISTVSSTPDASALGFGDSGRAIGFFREGQDIKRGDRVTRTDGGDPTTWEVEGVPEMPQVGTHVSIVSHVQVNLVRVDVTGGGS